MAKIDTASISGFGEMTPEQQVQALLGFEYDDGSAALKAAEETAAKLKAAVDKASSEAAGYKKQLNASRTEEERAKLETEETLRAMQEKLAEYEQREKVSAARAAFLGAGFDEQGAASAAEAFIAGDVDAIAAAMKAYRGIVETATKSQLMSDSPKPSGSSAPKVRTKADILAIQDYAEQQDAIAEYIAANGTW